MEIALSSCANSGIIVCSDRKLLSVELLIDIVMLNKNPNDVQVFLVLLNLNVGMFWMCFGFWKCKILFHDCMGLKPNLFLAGD